MKSIKVADKETHIEKEEVIYRRQKITLAVCIQTDILIIDCVDTPL